MARNNFLLVLLLAASNGVVACSTKGWQVNINGTANGMDSAKAVTVNSAGDVVAAGFTENKGARFGLTVVKISGTDGRELWRQIINGPGDASNIVNQATAVRTDTAGDVVATGMIGYHIIVVKFDGLSGTELWRQIIRGEAAEVAVDANDDVIAVDRSDNST